MTIWEIDRDIAGCVDENGEVIDFEKLMAISMERETKIENLACWAVNLKAEAEAIKAQEAVLKARREATERKAERLKEFLGSVLNGEKLTTARVAVSFRKTSAVDIAEGTELPEEYLTIKTTALPDKAAIKKALGEGVAIPGCQIVTRNAIQIK